MILEAGSHGEVVSQQRIEPLCILVSVRFQLQMFIMVPKSVWGWSPSVRPGLTVWLLHPLADPAGSHRISRAHGSLSSTVKHSGM